MSCNLARSEENPHVLQKKIAKIQLFFLTETFFFEKKFSIYRYLCKETVAFFAFPWFQPSGRICAA